MCPIPSSWSYFLQNRNTILKTGKGDRLLSEAKFGRFFKSKDRCGWRVTVDGFYCKIWPHILYQKVMIMQDLKDGFRLCIDIWRKSDVFFNCIKYL